MASLTSTPSAAGPALPEQGFRCPLCQTQVGFNAKRCGGCGRAVSYDPQVVEEDDDEDDEEESRRASAHPSSPLHPSSARSNSAL